MPPPQGPLWFEDADLLPEWLDAPSREAICAPDPCDPSALVAAARLLRGGHLPGGARARVEARLLKAAPGIEDDRLRPWIASRCASIHEALDHLEEEPPGTDLGPLLCARDDLESLAWALGLAGRAKLERDLLKRTSEQDRRAQALRDRLVSASKISLEVPRWLRALSEKTPGAWWSNLLLARDHREQISQWLTRPLIGSALACLSLSPSRLEQAAALHFGGAAQSQPETILARPLGPAVATLFDGAVQIHTHGLADHDQDVAPGLVVRHARGAFDTIVQVSLEPAGPVLPHRSPLALAWWVPLAGLLNENPPAARTLRVRLKEGSEAREAALPLGPSGPA